MDFELTDDQVALQEGVRKLCEGRRDEPELWVQLGDMGVFSLRLPEDAGGAGLGMAEAVLVFEELGRAAVPGPLVGTHLAAGVLPDVRAAGVVERTRAPLVVEHLGDVERLVVIDDDGLWSVDPASVDAEPVQNPLDPLTPVSRITGSLPQGDRVGDAADVARWRLEGAALVAGLELGLAGAATDLAVAYAKERQQFDRPIGSFQAVKHLCAEMLVRTEMARAAVYAAGVTLDDPEVGDPRRAVAAARVMSSDAAVANGKDAVQVHGGMGFTWEVDVHLYLKRAWVLATQFGTPDQHAETMASFVISA